MQPIQYSDEFIKNAMLVLVKSGKPVGAIAAELGISRSVLYKWKKKYNVMSLRRSFGINQLSIEAEIIISLKKEIVVLKQDIEVLRNVLLKTIKHKHEFSKE